MKHNAIAAAAAGLAIAAGLALAIGSGVASAAPTGDTSAAETIARLQADGNRVIVSKTGNGRMNQCSVTSISPVRTHPLPTGNPLTGVPNLQTITTVYVSLKC
ncbi:hypothetical protein M2272_002446 [Mycobacterium frederiksbergense]|uniref:DUF732 domain-containing protein n=1 Tax=Mycolicibacterium frederiksbergense TaxID=117567 RepID=A0ABT6KYM5_9MYCO|nr:hypothetical protein [Mycolicibacterium frederiksbergense]MDH6195806.1 hypothetical protein [Mycolicibacterium frederiksbergense]